MDVHPSRGERHLQRQAGLPHRAAGGMRFRQGRPRPLTPVDLLRIAIETDLDGAYRRARRSAAAVSKRWPLVSILSLTPARPRNSGTSKKYGTIRGSPPHSIT